MAPLFKQVKLLILENMRPFKSIFAGFDDFIVKMIKKSQIKQTDFECYLPLSWHRIKELNVTSLKVYANVFEESDFKRLDDMFSKW